MSDLDGEDMAILERFTKRPSAASLAGRRERETRPMAAADRRQITKASTKNKQLNLKVTPEFHERVHTLARIEAIAAVELVERAVAAYARAMEKG